MAYIINRYDGTELTVVDDGALITTATSLGLVGRNYVGYGEIQNENYVFLLENFSNISPPSFALSGQLWHDSANKTIRVYNGSTWNAVGNAQVQETEPEPSQGGLWLKSATNQLFVSDGSVWRLVGPEAIEGFNTTKLSSVLLRDQEGSIDRPVITVTIDGEIIAIYSKNQFTILAEDAPPGFTSLEKGLNFKSDSFAKGNLKGNADTATKLAIARRLNGILFDGSADVTIKASTTNPLKKGDYIVGSDWDGTFTDTWGVDATPLNRIGKVVARDANGDFAAGTVTADLVGDVVGNVTALSGTSSFSTITANIVNAPTFTGNAATATKLQNPPTINTVLFDGTTSITLPVPAETLVGDTLAPNVLSSSLISLGKLESLEIEAPGLKVGDGNDLSIFIEGFTPVLSSDVTNVLRFQLNTGSSAANRSDISYISATSASADGVSSPALVPDWNKSILSSQKINLGLPSYQWGNVFSEQFTGDSLNILQVNSTGAEVQFNDPLKAAAGLIGNLSGNVTGNVVGNLTGNVTGSASLNLLRTGGTLTGNISWTSDSLGLDWSRNSDGASIKFYNANDADTNSRLEFETRDNGNEYFSFAHTPSIGSKFQLAKLTPNTFGSSRLDVYGNIEATGTIQATRFFGIGSDLTALNAASITTGRLSNARLTGSYDIDISGTAARVTTITSGQVTGSLGYTPFNAAGGTITGDVTIETVSATLTIKSNRDNSDDALLRIGGARPSNAGVDISMIEFINYANQSSGETYALAQIAARDLNANSALKDGWIIFRTSDNGTLSDNMTLSEKGNLTVTGSVTATSFIGNGSALSINASNISSGTVPIGRLTGTYNIDITGQAATVTTITSGQVVSALGFTPFGSAGGSLVGDLTINKSSPIVTIKSNANAGEDALLRIGGARTGCSSCDIGMIEFVNYSNQSSGGNYILAQISAMDPRNNHVFKDGRLVFRTSDNGTLTENMSLSETGNLVVAGSVTASSFVGNGSSLTINASNLSSGTVPVGRLTGTYNIGISGTAARVTTITSGQVTGSLGYTPFSAAGGTITGDVTIETESATLTIKSNRDNLDDALLRIGGARPGNAGVDISMIEFINYANQSSGETYALAQIAARDLNANSALKDGWIIFRTSDNGTLSDNMTLSEKGNLTVTGSVTATSFVGSGAGLTISASNLSSGTVPVGRLSGTYNITITGNAASATNSTTASNVSGGFVSATTGSFSGVLNVSAGIGGGIKFPNDAFGGGGDTASITLESVSGEKTRLRFRVTNDAGISAVDDKAEFLVPDNDSLLVNNYVVLNAANYNNYTPSKTGTGASGTWGINISGTAASVSSISSAQVVSALGFTPANGSGPGNINGDQNYQDYLLRRPTIIDYSLYHNALGNRTGSVTINCESGNYVSCTATGAISFSFSNPATGSRATGLVLELTNGGNYTITWPSSVRWPSGTAPTLTTSGVDVLVFITDDSGSTWRGAVSMSDSR